MPNHETIGKTQIKVETSFTPDLIEQATVMQKDGGLSEISRQIIRLHDQGVRQALIKLGWTPPGEQYTQGKSAETINRLVHSVFQAGISQGGSGQYHKPQEVHALLEYLGVSHE